MFAICRRRRHHHHHHHLSGLVHVWYVLSSWRERRSLHLNCGFPSFIFWLGCNVKLLFPIALPLIRRT
jgi:hypothetical protein